MLVNFSMLLCAQPFYSILSPYMNDSGVAGAAAGLEPGTPAARRVPGPAGDAPVEEASKKRERREAAKKHVRDHYAHLDVHPNIRKRMYWV